MNAASVQLFGAALDASDFARVTDKPEVVPGQKSCSRKSPSDQSTTSSRSPEAGLKLEYFTEVEKFKNSPRWPAWSEIPRRTTQPTKCDVLHDFRALWQSPRSL